MVVQEAFGISKCFHIGFGFWFDASTVHTCMVPSSLIITFTELYLLLISFPCLGNDIFPASAIKTKEDVCFLWGYICLLWLDDPVIRFSDTYHDLLESSGTFSFHLSQNDCNIQGISLELVPFIVMSQWLVIWFWSVLEVRICFFPVTDSNCSWQPYKLAELSPTLHSLDGSKGRWIWTQFQVFSGHVCSLQIHEKDICFNISALVYHIRQNMLEAARVQAALETRIIEHKVELLLYSWANGKNERVACALRGIQYNRKRAVAPATFHSSIQWKRLSLVALSDTPNVPPSPPPFACSLLDGYHLVYSLF